MGDGGSIDGPVTIGTSPGTICLPNTADGDYTVGFDILRNHGKSPVEIEEVRLDDKSDLTLVDAYLVAIDKSTIGLHNEWPPPTGAGIGEEWDGRLTAVGAERLDPGHPAWNLVLHVRADADGKDAPSYKSVTIDYAVGSDTYRATNQTGLVIKSKC